MKGKKTLPCVHLERGDVEYFQERLKTNSTYLKGRYCCLKYYHPIESKRNRLQGFLYPGKNGMYFSDVRNTSMSETEILRITNDEGAQWLWDVQYKMHGQLSEKVGIVYNHLGLAITKATLECESLDRGIQFDHLDLYEVCIPPETREILRQYAQTLLRWISFTTE